MENKSLIITKRITKDGKQTVIIVPALLKETLIPRTLAEIRIDIISS